MKVFKIGPKGLNPCCEKSIKSLAENWLETSEVGDVFEVKVLEMTEEEYEALPEFTGP